MLRLLFVLLVARLGECVPLQHKDNITPRPGEKCGYESCTKPKDGYLNIHIVPHTHNDVGWLKTVDQYYYGSKKYIQVAGVQYILESVVNELWNDPKRKFIYVETAFFWQWWTRQNEEMKERVHTLVRQGRLQMTGGAWSMNDEAAAHYHSIVDQFTWGLRKLNDTFGECGMPLVGWQIDPFGHSREFASLLAAMGYDGLLLGRIDYQDKSAREDEKRMELIWRGSDELGESSDILTSVLYNQYQPPPGFCFDILCGDEPITDENYLAKATQFIEVATNMSRVYSTNNVLITMGEDFHYQAAGSWFVNLDRLILGRPNLVTKQTLLAHKPYIPATQTTAFLDFARTQAQYYTTGNIIITMGGDFTYQSASSWYLNLDLLIEHTNRLAKHNNLTINAFYSTPACYLKAVKDSNVSLTMKTDDFFPYASDPTAYWTGYFTSRPTTKYYERQSNTALQMFKQLIVFTGAEKKAMPYLDEFKSAMGMMQHHDAITGTEKQHVANDYMKILSKANSHVDSMVPEFFSTLMNISITNFQRCQLNISSCLTTMHQNFVVAVYNPVAWSVIEYLNIPVPNNDTYEIFNGRGEKLYFDMVGIKQDRLRLPHRLNQKFELVFRTILAPLSITSFYIQKKRPWMFSKTNDTVKLKDDLPQKSRHNKNMYKRIPEPLIKNEDVKINYDFNIDVLKDKYEPNEDIAMLEKIIEEAKKDNPTRRQDDGDVKKVLYPELSEEEKRMLGDDPIIVERPARLTLVDNEKHFIEFDAESGKFYVRDKTSQAIIIWGEEIVRYNACSGDNKDYSSRASGAYIFRPNGTETVLPVTRKHYEYGKILEYVMSTPENVTLRFRYYPEQPEPPTLFQIPFELFWTVGPINVDDNVGKEYALRFISNIVNEETFYTDSNGRQMIKRKLDYRPDYNVSLEEPIAGNYYPITNRITIKQKPSPEESEFLFKKSLTVLTDRSVGGTSLDEGDVEIMLHRRLLDDDAFGVGEALNETENGVGLVVTGRTRILILFGSDNDNIIMKQSAIQNDLDIQYYFAEASDNWMTSPKDISLINEFPVGLHLLTLEPWRDNELLMRLENFLEKGDRKETNINIDLKRIFRTLRVQWYRETSLGANKWKNDRVESDSLVVTVKAKEIRTFVVGYARL